ncbi:MAG: carboxypeptidase-like regulatory domain-containing protein [Oscillochloridaceae bacterium umkhey_bin13]
MPLEKSPSLNDFAQGLPPEPADPERRQRMVRYMIMGLMVILVLLLVANVVQSRAVARLSGMGNVRGQVLDRAGRPISAELIIERSELVINAGPDGRFAIQGVPAGDQLLVVAYAGVGVEYPVAVIAGSTVDVGTVQIATTAVPLP